MYSHLGSYYHLFNGYTYVKNGGDPVHTNGTGTSDGFPTNSNLSEISNE